MWISRQVSPGRSVHGYLNCVIPTKILLPYFSSYRCSSDIFWSSKLLFPTNGLLRYYIGLQGWNRYRSIGPPSSFFRLMACLDTIAEPEPSLPSGVDNSAIMSISFTCRYALFSYSISQTSTLKSSYPIFNDFHDTHSCIKIDIPMLLNLLRFVESCIIVWNLS